MKKIVDFFLKKSSKLAYFWFLQVQISIEVGYIIYGLKDLTETKSENSKANFHRSKNPKTTPFSCFVVFFILFIGFIL